MEAFAALIDRLSLTPSRNAKLRLMQDYFRATPDPDRGYALAAIAGDLDVRTVKPALLRRLIEEQIDPELFRLSYDYIGDLAETISLLWRVDSATAARSIGLSAALNELQQASPTQAPRIFTGLLDALTPASRYALIKLATGAMRIGVSSRMVKQALAEFGGRQVNEIEELWHGQSAPYPELFAWLEGRADKPAARTASQFRPVMLANPLEARDRESLDPSDYFAEWKWDGIRVQVTCEDGLQRLYSRSGDEISGAFPDLLEYIEFEGCLDGELLIGRPEAGGVTIGTFGDLQQRLNRKTVPAKVIKEYPVMVQAYDILFDGKEDVRSHPLSERRERLERFLAKLDPVRFSISPQLQFSNWDELAALRASPPHSIIEGVMLKRRDSAYVPGRPKGPWFKWKQEPKIIDAVLMYAQRGHGKRSSFYSDYTFGVWNVDGELVPVGKAYFGFTDEELKQIDKYVRDNTVERFGPVRSVRAEPENGLVFEVAFEGLNRSGRHKSGIAMRFPRISRLRWDKKPSDADRLETLERML
jgi:DNA ligase 1